MVNLQDEILAKEEAQACALRRRCDVRTVRFMNAKQRTIGIDRQELDRQVREKEEQRRAEREACGDEAEYQNQLCRFLEEGELASREARARDMEDVKLTLLEQMSLPKNNAPASGSPLDPETCGAASVQRLAGEDRGKARRTRAQQEQIRRWCADSIGEKGRMARKEAEEADMHAEYLLAEDKVRVDLALEDFEERADTNKMVQAENLELARQAQLQKMHEDERDRALNEEEVMRSRQSHFLTEDTDFAKSATSPHRYRPDHFKGFGKEQIKAMQDENNRVIQEKRANQAREAEDANDWASYQFDVVRSLEQVEIDQQRYIAEQNRLQALELEEQRRELKEKQKTMRKESFGAIEEGFFSRFGTSCR